MKTIGFKSVIVFLLLAIFTFANPVTIVAFKPKTHVWIAQQVLNDVFDDKHVTIEGNNYKIPDEIYKVLRNNPNEYRVGLIGPDIFPDVVVGQMTVHPGNPQNSNAWQSDDWLEWMMKSAKGDDMKSLAFGYLGHAASDIFAHTYVITYASDIFVLADYKKGGKDKRQFANEEKRHFAVESLIAEHTPPINDELNMPVEISRQFLSVSTKKIAESLILNETVFDQYLDRIADKEANFEEKISGLITGHLILMKLYRDRVKGLMNEQIKDSPIAKISKRIDTLNIDKTADSAKLTKINDQISIEKTKILTLESEIANGNIQSKEDLKQSKKTLQQFEKNQKKQTIKISKLNIEIKALETGKIQLTEKLTNWVETIETAVAEYVGMSLDVGIELTKDKGNPRDVITKWRTTKAALFLPPRIGRIVIEIQKILEKIRNIPGIKQVLARADKIKSYLNKKSAEGIAWVILGNQTKEVLNIIFDKIEEDKFNEIFVDKSGKHLLDIPDASKRIKRDMFLEGDFFNPEKFSAVHNSVVLAKLTLLGPEQLNQLVKNHYGEEKTPQIFSDKEYFNILFGSVQSIDGNHQWNEFAPPYLRDDGRCEPTRSERIYGRKNGFMLWANTDVRERVFRKIFKGPLAPSMETPELFGFENLMPANYPYKPTTENPFPEIDDCKGKENL